MTGTAVRWAWVFLDTPREDAERSWAFWSDVTGCPVVDRRGERGEFATLSPSRGAPWVKLQAVDEGPGGVHVDLDVGDVHAAASRAEALGAVRVGAIGDTVVVLRSPGGFVHCLTTWAGTSGADRSGSTSVLDQVCLDVPRSAWDAEVRYWAALTGWAARASDEPGFTSLVRPPELPVRVLLQRLEDDDGPVRGHVDLACADRAADVGRHEAAGASVVTKRHFWTVMRDPVGRVYCLTDRSPQPPPAR